MLEVGKKRAIERNFFKDLEFVEANAEELSHFQDD